jgi:hypothetical protein
VRSWAWALLSALMLINFGQASQGADLPRFSFFSAHEQCRCNHRPRKHPQPEIAIPIAYPVCFYDVELGAVNIAKAAWPAYSARLTSVLASLSGSRRSVTVVSSRSIVVLAQRYKHRRIERIWPEIACIGQSGGETSDTRRKICTKYLRQVLKAFDRGISVPSDIAEPICQTFLD